MRSLMILLFLLVCVLQISNAHKSIDLANSICCPKELIKVNVPIKQIESYYWTSDICATPRAIVYKTQAGKQICVNPESTLVKSQIEKLDKKTKSATASSSVAAKSATAKSATAITSAKSTKFTTAETSATVATSTTSAKSTTFTTAETSATIATSTTSATAATSGTSVKIRSSAV